ncbi:MAG: lytic transglycosylase domain-containing protein [Alphaproteobacteria bacterium]
MSLFCIPAFADGLSPVDLQYYRQAFKALDQDKATAALLHAGRAKDRTLLKVVQGAVMAMDDNPYDFAATSSFVERNKIWPERRAIMAQMEKKLPDSMTYSQIAHWFDAHPPISMRAFDRYIAALRALRDERAATMIRARWIGGDFDREGQNDFIARHGDALRAQDHARRLDRLIEDSRNDDARRMASLVDGGQRALIAARLALASGDSRAAGLIGQLPPALRDDPGLLLDRLRAARRRDDDIEAVSLLGRQPASVSSPESWWNERHIVIRRMMERGDNQAAYDLALKHGLSEGQAFAQAEFLAGWLALRFLHDASEAREHFSKLYEASLYPISKARGAYWLARAYAARGDGEQARSWYKKAAQYPLTFYGQLALAQLDPKAVLNIAPDAAPSQDERDDFSRKEFIKIARQLHQLGESSRVKKFLYAAAEQAEGRKDFTMIAQFALKLDYPDCAVRIAKTATQKGFMLAEGYPLPRIDLPREPEPALILALIRQESMFDPDIVSPAGAQGLMQLMPGTARDLARKLSIKYKKDRLFDPNYNMRLGSRFLADRLDQFSGSFIMATASYNAGPGRVREWCSTFGGPQQGSQQGLDPVDWIELIPIYETRNYVQRVIEGTQIYRARLRGGRAPLKIMEDLQAIGR